MSNFNKVKDFMSIYGQEIKNNAEFPDKKIIELRLKLIQEELNEFKEAIKNRDIIENFIKRFELKLTHIHPNNYGKLDKNNDPVIIELSFEKYPKILDGNVKLPNILDQKNNPKKNDIFIKFNNT